MDALKSQFPKIATLLASLTEQQATSICLAVAKQALAKTGVEDQYALNSATLPEEASVEKLKHISEEIEQPYIESLDSGEMTETNKKLFLQARAIYSLAEAVSRPALEHIGICVYEALHANDTNTDEIEEIIQQILNDK